MRDSGIADVGLPTVFGNRLWAKSPQIFELAGSVTFEDDRVVSTRLGDIIVVSVAEIAKAYREKVREQGNCPSIQVSPSLS